MDARLPCAVLITEGISQNRKVLRLDVAECVAIFFKALAIACFCLTGKHACFYNPKQPGWACGI